MFGISFSEVMVIAIVALIVVGPRRLPEILGTAGRWIGKIRNITSEMRKQTGIDDLLRQEGLQGGLQELRSLMRPGLGNLASLTAVPGRAGAPSPAPTADPYGESTEFDRDREYPNEGADAYGAIPEDLLPDGVPPLTTSAAPAADSASVAVPSAGASPDPGGTGGSTPQ